MLTLQSKLGKEWHQNAVSAVQRHLGTFGSEKEAVTVYQRVAIKIGHPAAQHFCSSNPYQNRFLLLHKVPYYMSYDRISKYELNDKLQSIPAS